MFKKFLLINIIIFATTLTGYAFSESDIDFLEQQNYGTVYSAESFAERLQRLENDMLGMSQGGDLDSRVEKLIKLNQNNVNAHNLAYLPQDMNMPDKKENAIRKFFNGISETFFDDGTLTGFTPSYGIYDPIYGQTYGNTNSYPSTVTFGNSPGLFGNFPSYCQYYGTNIPSYSRPYYGNNSWFNNINRKYYNKNYPGYHNTRTGHRHLPPHIYANNSYNPYYGSYSRYNPVYSPADIITRSAVHILKD